MGKFRLPNYFSLKSHLQVEIPHFIVTLEKVQKQTYYVYNRPTNHP